MLLFAAVLGGSLLYFIRRHRQQKEQEEDDEYKADHNTSLLGYFKNPFSRRDNGHDDDNFDRNLWEFNIWFNDLLLTKKYNQLISYNIFENILNTFNSFNFLIAWPI